MSIAVTCASILSALASVPGGTTLVLRGDCPSITIERTYSPPITIEADGAVVRGLVVTGGGIVWRGGTIRAPGGVDAGGGPGYGAKVTGRNTTFDKVLFTESNRGIATDGAIDLTVKDSQFEMGQDGIIASRGSGLDIIGNVFRVKSRRPSLCAMGAKTIEGLPARVCKAQGGQWRDGWHQDAIQLRNGIDGIRVIGNKIEAVDQGIGEMNAKTDAPLSNVLIKDNDIGVSGFHSITIGEGSTNVRIVNNKVRQTTGRKTIIRIPTTAVACENDVQRPGDPGAGRCR